MTPILGVVLLLASADGAAANPFAQAPAPDAARYKACMAEAVAAPDVARQAAETWLQHEGGAPAKHCLGSALAALGEIKAGAAWIEEAADDLSQERGHQSVGAVVTRPLIADLKAAAAELWLAEGDYERARARLTEAIALQPGNAAAVTDLLINRAQASAGLGRYDHAVEDLTRAIGRAPGRVDAYVLRATAARMMGHYDEAELDLARALARAPDHPAGLLERGIVRRLTGDNAAAKADWQRLAKLYPGTETAELALDNLELLRAEE